MTDTAATIEAEVAPFVENEREIAYRSEATSQVAQGPAGRPARKFPCGDCGRTQKFLPATLAERAPGRSRPPSRPEASFQCGIAVAPYSCVASRSFYRLREDAGCT